MATKAQRLHNPGNLKRHGGFMVFRSDEEGFAALEQDLLIKMTGRSKTKAQPGSSLLEFSHVWAPASDGNDPVAYSNMLAQRLGVPVETPIGSLTGRVGDLAKAIAHNEGFYVKQ